MLTINSKLKLKNKVFENRIIVPPMASQTADELGFVTEETLSHYESLSKSKASLIFVEYSYINTNGKGEKNQLAIDSFDKLIGLKQLATRIKSSGSLAGIQIVHAGGKSNTEITGSDLIAPSNIATPVKNNNLEKPKAANQDTIEQLKEDYLNAFKIAVKAGFDIIEIHAAHGYGMNQWLSPITNNRSDQYGGSLYNRARLLFDIVKEFKNLYPDTILSVRLPGQDHLENGITSCDSILLSKKLTELGVDIINVSSGIGGWRRPSLITGEGYLVEDAKKIQRHINAPVIGVGGIKTKKYIEDQLNNGAFTFAAIGRAILNNPEYGKTLLL